MSRNLSGIIQNINNIEYKHIRDNFRLIDNIIYKTEILESDLGVENLCYLCYLRGKFRWESDFAKEVINYFDYEMYKYALALINASEVKNDVIKMFIRNIVENNVSSDDIEETVRMYLGSESVSLITEVLADELKEY